VYVLSDGAKPCVLENKVTRSWCSVVIHTCQRVVLLPRQGPALLARLVGLHLFGVTIVC
jgi:hypothetical protein